MTKQLVEALLFKDAATYRNPIAGTSGYDRWFAAQGPCDASGRSLREFDLHTRLFRYPLSYVIYSEAFDALPQDLKTQIYARIREVLTGQAQGTDFAYLTAADKSAILQILTATKPEFAASLQAKR
jgi:alpha-D-ribose 1-methylphosphonate 5-triphosphate synthase subunit PhnI